MKVIKGTKREKPDMYVMYSKALCRYLVETEALPMNEKLRPEELMKYLFLSVNYIIRRKKRLRTLEEVRDDFDIINGMFDAFSQLSPQQLMQVFPPEKRYDGSRYEVKDYFSTMEAVRRLDPGKELGDRNTVIDLFWDYQNRTIRLFMVFWMRCISDMRRLDGYPGGLEEFCANNGIHTYTMHEKEGYAVDNTTGEVHKIRKPRKRIPKYLSVAGGERRG